MVALRSAAFMRSIGSSLPSKNISSNSSSCSAIASTSSLTPLHRDFFEFAFDVRRRRDRTEVVGVDDLLHREQIDDAEELVFRADRHLNRNRARAEALANFVDDVEEVRAHAVHLVDEDDARNFVLVGLAPDGLRLRLHGGNRIEQRDETVEHAQRAFDFDREVDVARRIDNVDTGIAPRRRGCGGRDRDAAFLFLDHPVHRRRTVVHFADLVHAAGVKQNALGAGGFSRIDVRGNTDVPSPLERILSCSHVLLLV